MLGLEQAYELTRGMFQYEKDFTDIAMINAYHVLDLEWAHGIFIEQRLEHFFLQIPTIMAAVDVFYIAGHVGVTLAVIGWLYWKRRSAFLWVRNLLMVATAIALVVFYVFPTAPPRLLGQYGFVDPLLVHHLTTAGGAQPGSYTYNPYAAMPSLHVAYALIVAIGLILAERRLAVRILAALYPVAMAATVLISGNHWLLDVVGAAVTVGAAALLIRGWSILTAHAQSRFSGRGTALA